MTFPTGEDVSVKLTNGEDLLSIENEAVHLMPFIGGLYTPNDRFFAQGFLQVDVDANGNPVHVNNFAGGMTQAGTINDATYLYADLGMGYVMYRNYSGTGLIDSFAPVAELHYNRSLNRGDVVRSGLFRIGEPSELDLLNVLVGGTAQIAGDKLLTVAYVAPLGGGGDQQFDGELRVIFNWYFGASRPTGPY